MNRRNFIKALGATAAAAMGCSALPEPSPSAPSSDYGFAAGNDLRLLGTPEFRGAIALEGNYLYVHAEPGVWKRFKTEGW